MKDRLVYLEWLRCWREYRLIVKWKLNVIFVPLIHVFTMHECLNSTLYILLKSISFFYNLGIYLFYY